MSVSVVTSPDGRKEHKKKKERKKKEGTGSWVPLWNPTETAAGD